jgi:hypothetical protein
MQPPKRPSLLTLEAVINDHGGEAAFWALYLAGALSPDVAAWVRTRAEADPNARSWLAVVESAEARRVRHRALEMVNYLVDLGGDADELVSATEDELTHLVQEPAARGCPVYREKLRDCLFQLLDEVEIRLPADGESHEATLLLEVLVGRAPVQAFGEMTAWLRDVRRRAAAGEQLERLAAALVPELVEKEHGRWRYQLSFRLLLRDRFRRYVESRGWTPQGPRFHEVDTAFDALTRRRIGELARAAAADPDAGDLREGWELVCAEFVD